MTAAVEARIWCDHRGEPDEFYKHGRPCDAKFTAPPELGFVSRVAVVRREARKAGWTLVRWPSSARWLDKDYCPAHKPQEDQP